MGAYRVLTVFTCPWCQRTGLLTQDIDAPRPRFCPDCERALDASHGDAAGEILTYERTRRIPPSRN